MSLRSVAGERHVFATGRNDARGSLEIGRTAVYCFSQRLGERLLPKRAKSTLPCTKDCMSSRPPFRSSGSHYYRSTQKHATVSSQPAWRFAPEEMFSSRRCCRDPPPSTCAPTPTTRHHVTIFVLTFFSCHPFSLQTRHLLHTNSRPCAFR